MLRTPALIPYPHSPIFLIPMKGFMRLEQQLSLYDYLPLLTTPPFRGRRSAAGSVSLKSRCIHHHLANIGARALMRATPVAPLQPPRRPLPLPWIIPLILAASWTRPLVAAIKPSPTANMRAGAVSCSRLPAISGPSGASVPLLCMLTGC